MNHSQVSFDDETPQKIKKLNSRNEPDDIKQDMWSKYKSKQFLWKTSLSS